ncbi:hypothetical protein SLNWT_0474 [Streptomyces albus]|uniref:Uncharacterized protein n=1 Tax=Streptomyces albus (strain ATCC 21838 / DSM 41398 / FERM P-419 / JCM 4703 / NBRC 107858) TaxID=1081613 RepID=A0A0B5ENH9_STRA4|nr:hypothetical protein SLNWT_0474 [Streptomyces albus]AOU75162.1 hypothetical protein SLNHY_0471 [Streptomyces albus]AYN30968.1 hypothetical protein DUI70_0465 [Streptomyces albus]
MLFRDGSALFRGCRGPRLSSERPRPDRAVPPVAGTTALGAGVQEAATAVEESRGPSSTAVAERRPSGDRAVAERRPGRRRSASAAGPEARPGYFRCRS